MKLVGALFLAVLGLSAAAPLTEDASRWLFTHWIAQYSKQYESNELQARYEVFRNNLQFINKHNELAEAGKKSYTLAMNEFGDLTSKEFAAKFVGKIPQRNPADVRRVRMPAVKADDSIDWRKVGAVTPIKNQGQCGSCWAFSTTGTMEGMWFQYTKNTTGTGQLVSLSEQQLVDCTRTINYGCSGGWPDKTIDWLAANGGSCLESDYKYTARDGTCKKTCKAVAQTSGVVDLTGEDDIYPALQMFPVSILIEADQPVFQFYSGGVFDDLSCGFDIDHAVLVAGYNADDDTWIVKNSWGTSCGAQGYIYMKRGINICGISTGPAIAKPPTGLTF
jgi:C1A family cysteine protease